MNPLSHPLHWKLQKNEHLLRALVLRQAPAFVYRRRATPPRQEIPVFTFHGAEPEIFESQCRHLAENGYLTLTADEFRAALDGRHRPSRPAVFLTFDDGLKEVWTVVFPLLQRYGLKATCFLIPGLIPDDDRSVRQPLVGGSAGGGSAAASSGPPVATWAEIRIMHESGIVDFHSHTMHHQLVHASPRLFDFIHPGYDPYFYGNIHVPVYRRHGRDITGRHPVPGMPVYRGGPRMSVQRRYLDDEGARELCIEAVARGGGASFFTRPDWRRQLQAIVAAAASPGGGRYETDAEREAELMEELTASRQAIEAALPGKRVEHLCYPWFEAGDLAVELSRRAGYTVNYFGYRRGRPTNRPGDDPFAVVRVDEVYLRRLPGAGRVSLAALVGEEIRRAASHLRGSGGPPPGGAVA